MSREKKDTTKMNYSSCSDLSRIKKNAIFSSLSFFFPRTSFFTAQNVGPIVQNQFYQFINSHEVKEISFTNLLIKIY